MEYRALKDVACNADAVCSHFSKNRYAQQAADKNQSGGVMQVSIWKHIFLHHYPGAPSKHLFAACLQDHWQFSMARWASPGGTFQYLQLLTERCHQRTAIWNEHPLPSGLSLSVHTGLRSTATHSSRMVMPWASVKQQYRMSVLGLVYDGVAFRLHILHEGLPHQRQPLEHSVP